MNQTIHVRASKQFIYDTIRSIPKAAEGSGEAATAVKALLVRIGIAALGRIHSQFIVKARGGTDDCGLKWKPLKPSTIAYSRRHPGVLWPGSKRAPFAPSWMLTKKQRERWWALYRGFGGLKPTGRAYHSARGGDWAAARAWNIIKAEGGKTLIGEYGNTQVDILRSTGLLLNSLSPGLPTKTGNPRYVRDQVFRLEQGAVIVGTNREWAGVHHNGGGHVPQRRLWAIPSQWPDSWWNDIGQQAAEGLLDIALFMLKRKIRSP